MNFDSNEGQLIVCKLKLEHLLGQIKKIADDLQMPGIEKLSKLEIIKEEMKKVQDQIDIIKKNIILIKTFNTN